MDIQTLQRRAVAAIAAITVLTGAAQMAAGERLLALIATSPTPLGGHLFATIGMFMVLFGGVTLHALRRRDALPVVLLWGSLQKLLAAAMVAWGVARGAFIPLALAVAAFDFASGLLYWSLRRKGG